MKQYSKLFSLVALLGATTSIVHADDGRVLPFLQWRSQGRDTARKLYGTTSFAVYQPELDGITGTFSATVQYDRSFRNSDIAGCLFGPALVELTTPATTTTGTTTTTNRCNDSCSDNVIVISGLNSTAVAPATTRGPRDLMAENFILPRDFRSTISFSPKVQDVLVDFNLFVGLDRWLGGLYFRLYGPVVWNKVSLNPSENVIAAGTASTRDPVTGAVTVLGGGYQQGFFDPNVAVPTQALFPNALSFFGGCTYPDRYVVPAAAPGAPFAPATVQPLRFAKFSDCPTTTTSTNNCDNDCNSSSHHKTGFAELRAELGYNYMTECCRFLINLQAAAPTGSKVKAEYLFPAYVGNGHHWELGVGLGGAWKMWRSEDDDKSFSFIVEADITHLFKAKQQRTFDLKCKPLSRYMLAEQLITPTDAGEQLIPPTPAINVFSPTYAPVANFSTRDVKVSIGVQGDLVAMFNYTCCGFSWDLGYNFWAMSGSKISLADSCDDTCGILPFPTNFALKGDASVGGYGITGGGISSTYGLGATETGTATTTGATIFGGVGAGVTNANVDNFFPAVGNDGAGVGVPLFAFDPTGAFAARINTSNPPVFISIDDLDLAGAEQRGLSHKVFTHFSYTWRDRWERWVPYVGFGASGEFGSHNGSEDCPTTTTADCDTCPSALSCALSKWAVEIKGGVSFH